MVSYTRSEVAQVMNETGMVPLFYDSDIEAGKSVISACFTGGARLLKFTSRGDFAHEVFNELDKYVIRELPGMILGVVIMIMKSLIPLICLLSSACLLSCNSVNEKRSLKLAHGLDVNHSVHKAMVKLAEDLEEISGGKMGIEIYPNQQLGTERECLELLQIGSLDMTKVSVGVMENFAPRMKVLGLPFLFRDRSHSFDVLDGPIGKELLNEGMQYWLKGLCYYDAGSRSFYTKEKPVYSPDDLEGLKIRVMESVTAMDMVKSLGGSPTPISWGELYTSLQQGVVDGAENNPPSFYLSRHYEVCRYYSLDEHTVLPDLLIIGTQAWSKLSDLEKLWLEKAVENSVGYQRELWAQAEKEALDAVIEAGVEVIRPEKDAFFVNVQSVYKKYEDDPGMLDLILRIRESR